MNAIMVIGLGFGDEGKGTIVDSLVRQYRSDLVVRFNGGAQAAHHVVTDEGLHHCFAQFGSGTLAGARTHLSHFVMVEPSSLLREANSLKDLGFNPFAQLTIDPRAPVLTPYHRDLNQLREYERPLHERHGSCGMGIGELASDLEQGHEVLTMGALVNHATATTMTALRRIQERLYDAAISTFGGDIAKKYPVLSRTERNVYWFERVRTLRELIKLSGLPTSSNCVIFEGAQGVLLDQKYGFHPNTTWSNCTFDNALSVWGEAGGTLERVQRMGVTRCYATRHGYGPFPTETELNLTPGEHNENGMWQGQFRVGHLDRVLLDYAVRAVRGVDHVALTCADKLKTYGTCDRYDFDDLLVTQIHVNVDTTLPVQKMIGHMLHRVRPQVTVDQSLGDLIRRVEETCRAPVSVTSYGPTALTKKYEYREGYGHTRTAQVIR